MAKYKITDVLSHKEKNVLRDSFDGWVGPLCQARWKTLSLFLEIIRNTLDMNQFVWNVNLSDYFFTPGNGFDGLFSPAQVYKSLKSLEKKGLIQVTSVQGVKAIRLNLPGIVYTVSMLWADSKLHFRWKPYLEQWKITLASHWISCQWEVDLDLTDRQEHLMKLKESVEAAKQQSRDARKRQRDKKKAKEEKTVSLVISCIQEAYEEHLPGIRYSETWTAKLKGQAANWLKELSTANPPIDPAEAVNRFVKNWRRLSGKVTDHYGNSLILGDLPTFQVYYRFRSRIEEGLRKLGEQSQVKYVSDSVHLKEVHYDD